MFIELVDVLRCPAPHEETWLVAAFEHLDGRDVIRGTLGCPVCRGAYPVRDGAVHFGESPGPMDAAGAGRPAVTADEVMRVRALLHLVDDGGIVAFAGAAARLADPVAGESAVTPLLLNPTGIVRDVRASVVLTDDVVPLAPGVLRAAIVEGEGATPAFLAGLVRALRPGGRLVAPVACPLPDGAHELARDARQWVAERASAVPSRPVALQRR